VLHIYIYIYIYIYVCYISRLRVNGLGATCVLPPGMTELGVGLGGWGVGTSGWLAAIVVGPS